MSLLDELRALYVHTVSLEPFAGLDDYGTATYGEAVEYSARIQQRAKRVRTAEGEEVTSMTQVFLAPTPPMLTTRDRITLPTPFTPTQPPILSIQQSADEDGTLISSVFC